MSKHIGVHFSWQVLNFDHRFLQKPYRKKKWHISLPFFAIHPPCTPKECAGPSEGQEDRNKNSSQGRSWVLLRKARDASG